jgi:hypothetical protein
LNSSLLPVTNAAAKLLFRGERCGVHLTRSAIARPANSNKLSLRVAHLFARGFAQDGFQPLHYARALLSRELTFPNPEYPPSGFAQRARYNAIKRDVLFKFR